MGLEDIRRKILADAEKQRDDLVRQANLKKKELLDAAAKKASDYSAGLTEQARQEADGIRRGIATDARLRVKNEALAKKRALMEEVFAKALDSFMAGKNYAQWLANRIAAAVETGKEEVVFSRADKAPAQAIVEAVNKQKKIELTVSAEKGSFRGGAILRNGDTAVNITLDTLLDISRETLEKQSAEILFREK